MNKNKTMLCSMASLLSAGVLMGGCMADVGGESEGVAEEGPNVAASEEVGEAKQAITCGVLYGGETLYEGQSNTSCDGRFRLTAQTDGNLVLYGSAGARWATYTFGAGYRLAMQTDGNLVIYTPSNQAVWHSQTYGNPGARLAIQNDGNMAIYSSSNQLLWSSTTTWASMYGGKTYRFTTTRMSWNRARTWCHAIGGYDLVIPSSSAEELWVRGQIGTGYFIGATDSAVEGTWRWLNGTLVSSGYSNWQPGSPNQNGDEDCGYSDPNWGWVWDDNTCADSTPFPKAVVCES